MMAIGQSHAIMYYSGTLLGQVVAVAGGSHACIAIHAWGLFLSRCFPWTLDKHGKCGARKPHGRPMIPSAIVICFVLQSSLYTTVQLIFYSFGLCIHEY